jgi:outer membrane protein OmpA-like peptidoglycan-associated protein
VKTRIFSSFVTQLSTLTVLAVLIVWCGGGAVQAQDTQSAPPATPDQQSQPQTAQPSTPQQPAPSTPDAQQPTQTSPEQNDAAGVAKATDVQEFSGTVTKVGDKYVLKDDSGQTYDIDHQDEVKKFDGKRVRVKGTLDETGKKILVK